MHYQTTKVLRNLKPFVAFSIVLEFLSLHQGFSVVGNPAVCTKHESYYKSRYVSYLETYKAKKWGIFKKTATRANYRWEYFKELRQVEVCCHGYEPGSSTSKCVPVCPSGCKNGECYQPNVCKCFPGYVTSLNTRNGYLECVAGCPAGCDGGVCTAPGTCTCSHRYKLSEARNSCEPECSSLHDDIVIPGCGDNATCIAPDTCQCHDGYEKNPKDSLCVPKCTPPCGSNAFCISPDKCLCNIGYIIAENLSLAVSKKPNGYIECVPHCPNGCNGGICAAPGNCTCNAGYELAKEQNSCEPVCFSTLDGLRSPGCGDYASCIAPDTCQCHEGYEKNPEDSLCLPKCTPPCGLNAFCISPDKCVCYIGYGIDTNPLFAVGQSPVNNLNETTSKPQLTTSRTTVNAPTMNCKPLCEPECGKNSSCSAPNMCQCDSGYRSETLLNQSTHLLRCVPVCEKTCVNALCAYPNTCLCHSGYEPHSFEDFVCVPICRDECVYASCTQPDHCECYDGYVKEFNDGEHHANVSTNKCIPSCADGCPNGKCVAPEQCVCDEGYILSGQDTTTDISFTMDYSIISTDLTSPYSTDSTNYYYSPDTTGYSSTDSSSYTSTDSSSYTSTDSSSYSSSSESTTIALASRQVCEPLCEPDCPAGSICIEPNKCHRTSDSDHNLNDFGTNGSLIKSESNNCDGSKIENGSTCRKIESAILNQTTASIIGILILLATILGLGVAVFLTRRRKKLIVTQGLTKSAVAMVDHSEASDLLFATDESSYL